MTVIQLETGYLDVKEESVVPINLSIGDIRDVGSRNGMFSKTITLPGTDNNNNLLNHYYDVNIDAGTFDVNVITRCSIIQNGLLIIENAILQLVSVNKIQKNSRHEDEVTYDVFIKDDVSDLFTAIGQKELTDLDFSELDHTISASNVVDTFANDYTDGYIYLLGYNNTNNYPLTEMRPSIFVRKYLDKMFADAGFSYTWSEMSDIGINNLVIPYNGDQLQIDNSQYEVQATDTHTTTTAQTTTGIGVSFQEQLVTFTEILDGENLFNPTTGEYEVPIDVVPGQHINFGWSIDFDMILDNVNAFDVYLVRQTGIITINAIYKAKLYTYKNGILHAQNEFDIRLVPDGSTITASTADTISSGSIQFNTQVTNANVGDILTFKVGVDINQSSGMVRWRDGATVVDPTVRVDVDLDITALSVTVDVNSNVVSSGATIPMNLCVPKKIKQNDFLKSILKMFNCYIIPDKDNSRKVTIVTRDSYYDSGSVKDWSNKLAKDQPQMLQFLPELNSKRKILSYSKDDDTPNKVYTDATNEVYGQIEIVFDNEYIKGIDTDELIFSPTPVTLTSFGAYVPMISFGAPATNIKIVYIGGTETCSSFNVYDYNATGETNLTTYPLAGHFNHPLNPTYDINFGTSDFYYYSGYNLTNNNLYNVYHRRLYSQLNSGKMLSAMFYLTEDDVQNLNLNDKIRIDNSWWNINKVIDYDANSNSLTKIELISVDDEIDLPPFRVRPIRPNVATSKPVKGIIESINNNNNTIGDNTDANIRGRYNVVGNNLKVDIVGDGITTYRSGMFTEDTAEEFKAVISVTQSGTDAPVITEISNTLGELTTEYVNDGDYRIKSDGLFTDGRTTVRSQYTNNAREYIECNVDVTDPKNEIYLLSFNSAYVQTNGILENYIIEIIVS